LKRQKKEEFMKKSLLWTLILSFSSLLILDSCKSQDGNAWDDSSNVGSYKRAKARVLWGDGSTEEVAVVSEARAPVFLQEEDFIALEEEDLRQQFSDVVFAQPKESPGEEGSTLPGIHGFHLPAGALTQIFRTVYFDTNEFTVNKPEHMLSLQKAADYLKKNPKTYIFVAGACDQRGPEAYNLALGARRANFVRNFLIEQKGKNQT